MTRVWDDTALKGTAARSMLFILTQTAHLPTHCVARWKKTATGYSAMKKVAGVCVCLFVHVCLFACTLCVCLPVHV